MPETFTPRGPLVRSVKPAPNTGFFCAHSNIPLDMPLEALQPLHADAARRAAAVETFSALAGARMATLEGVLAFGGRSGFDPGLLALWLSLGLVQRAVVPQGVLATGMVEVFALTPAGARELTQATGTVARGVTPARFKRSGRKLLHDASLGDVALAVLAARREGLVELVGLETDDRMLSTSAVVAPLGAHPVRVPLQPDGYVVTRSGGRLRGLLLELDRDTISPSKMAAKYEAYLAWHRQGGPERSFHLKAMRLLTIVPSASRLKRLHAAALEATGGQRSGFFLFVEAEHVSARDPARLLEPIATMLGDGLQVPLFPPQP